VAALAMAVGVLVSAAVACTGGSAPGGARGDVDGGRGDSSTSPDAPTLEASSFDASLDGGLDGPIEAGVPSLVALAVSAPDTDASSPVTLSPAFSPDVHDYTVRCSAGTNILTVSMKASPGAASLLLQPTPSASLPQQTLSIRVTEGQAVVAAATDGTATVEYWVRCLPHDFPVLEWTPHPNAGALVPGYYLIGTDEPTTSGCYAIVLDAHGVPVWYSQAQTSLGWCIFDVDSVVPGSVSFDSVVDYPAEFELHQLSPPVTTKIAPAGLLNVDLHELLLLANGDYLVISSPLQSGVDLTGMQVLKLDGGLETLTASQPIMACNIIELAPDGTVVWTWTATDHFDVLEDSIVPQLLPYGPNANLVVDPIHCNSIDVDPTSGDLLVSARQLNSIFYIQRSTGNVLWKMGGSPASKDGATYVSVADPFVQQHDARFQPGWSSTCNGGSGPISLFDDQTYEPNPARALVYDVTVGAGDAGGGTDGGCGDGGAAAGTATVAWQRAGAGPSLAMGSFRILPDGSRIIGWGDIPGAGFTEVDVDGNDLADLTFPDGNTTYRALKVPVGTFDLGALRSSAGIP
jgi:hypothetical protein